MTDPWEPTIVDREAYHRGVDAVRRGRTIPAHHDEVLQAGLREAFASLRARVGEPVTGELVSMGADGWEYAQVSTVEQANELGADGWCVVQVVPSVDEESGLHFVMERPRQPGAPS